MRILKSNSVSWDLETSPVVPGKWRFTPNEGNPKGCNLCYGRTQDVLIAALKDTFREYSQ